MNDFKILFLYPNFRSESLVPPSITLLSRILKNRGFKIDIFDSTNYEIDDERNADKIREKFLTAKISDHLNIERKNTLFEDLNKKVDEFKPDLIAVSSTESTFLLGIQLLKGIKNQEIPVILGGVFATFAPERALQFEEIDIVCVGEGEEALLELCEKMSKGKDYSDIAGLWMKDNQGNIICNPIRKPININSNPIDLDIGLFGDNRLYRPMAGKLYRMLSVETQRGCPFDCHFCNSPAQNRLYLKECNAIFFRKKSFDKIYKELIYYRDVWKVEYIFFWADTFLAMTDKELDEFCEIYSEIKIPFFAQTRLETVTEDRLIRLKNIGLHRLGFGIEHGNEKFRREVVNRLYSNKMAIDRLKIPAKLGIQFSVNNIIGFPDETPELAMDTVELNRQIASDTTGCAIFMPYYGTILRELAVQHKYIESDVICPGNSEDSILNMLQFPKERIKGLRRVFAMYIKFPKERWPEIKMAEELTPEGDIKWHELRKEFVETFFGKKPESDF